MKKATITISFDEEKLSALKLYLDQKELQVETELETALDTLYTKTVPVGVREFLDLRLGVAVPPQPKPRKPRITLSAVGVKKFENPDKQADQ